MCYIVSSAHITSMPCLVPIFVNSKKFYKYQIEVLRPVCYNFWCISKTTFSLCSVQNFVTMKYYIFLPGNFNYVLADFVNNGFLFATSCQRIKSHVVESQITLLVWACLSLALKEPDNFGWAAVFLLFFQVLGSFVLIFFLWQL